MLAVEGEIDRDNPSCIAALDWGNYGFATNIRRDP
jgi:hypothetical protein